MMKLKKNGLNDSDKVLITIALWICAIALFVATLSLPMLPDHVTIFAPPETEEAHYYSKYYNLLIILTALAPAAIVLVTAFIKKRNRLQNNFLSIVLFSIMLALCMNSVILYGMLKQFDASKAVKLINFYALSVIVISFVLSVLCSLMPMILRKKLAECQTGSTLKSRFVVNLCRFWNCGAYGFLICAIIGSFIPSAYGFLALAVMVIAVIVFMLCVKVKPVEQEQPTPLAEKDE